MCAVSPVSLACGLTVCVCVYQNFWPTSVCEHVVDPETAHELKAKDISLAGIAPDQTTADFRRCFLTSPDAVLLASDLSKAGVSASLTSVRSPGYRTRTPRVTIA